MKKQKKFIISQMFDVRPVNERGELDLEKIASIEKTVRIKNKRIFKNTKKIGEVFYDIRETSSSEEEIKRFQNFLLEEEKLKQKIPSRVPVVENDFKNIENIAVEFKNVQSEFESDFLSSSEQFFEDEDEIREKTNFKQNIFQSLWSGWHPKKTALSFGIMAVFLFLLVSNLDLLSKGFKIKNNSLSLTEEAYGDLMEAKNQLAKKDFQKSKFEFQEAHDRLAEISKDMDNLGTIVIESSRFIPFVSKLSSGNHLVKAGENVSQIGILASETLATLNNLKNPNDQNSGISYLEIFKNVDRNLQQIAILVGETNKHLEKVSISDIPEEKRDKFVELKNKLPQISDSISRFVRDEKVFVDVLGGNGPRKYLFLFQNNQEIRATGGFIGTYGLLDIFNGRVRKFFVDGIFNPDGQLQEKVVPPKPIQKISATWSLHDSNWFPDFPVSAEKAAWFYEKTGGPTVDGVITMTPDVLEKLLEITGPIEMPEYGVTVDKENFVEKIQYEVEVGYDKELNQPKKILSDLAPRILDKIFNAQDIKDVAKTMTILVESLDEKHILIYSTNFDIQKIISERGWSGEILDTQKDYLSIINTNINGFKSDGVINEEIEHEAKIQDDGSIIDTVTVTRHHNGGNLEFDFWNKVNADYMRVYVPKGAKLMSVSGQTREFNSPPLDYAALGFRNDPQVKMEEDSMVVDEENGTRIYEEAGKTVFANWVYVSPQETVQIKYVYLLPFKLDADLISSSVDTYSLLTQKQSGSKGSKFKSRVIYPKAFRPMWKYPEENISELGDLPENQSGIIFDTDLKTDKFLGVAFGK